MYLIQYNKKLNELNNYNYVWIIYKSSPTTSSSEIRTCTWDVKIDKLIEWLIYSALIFRSVVDILSKLNDRNKQKMYVFFCVFKKTLFYVPVNYQNVMIITLPFKPYLVPTIIDPKNTQFRSGFWS